MEHYQIVNIQEVLEQKEGVAYQGEIGVFVPDNTRDFALAEGNPVYVNAFSYVLVLGGSASLSVDEHVYEIFANQICVLSPLHLTCFSRVSDDFKCMFLCLHKDFVDRISGFSLKQRISKGMNLHRNPVLSIAACDMEVLAESIEYIRSQILRKGHLYHQELIQNALIKFYLELDNVLDRKTNHAEQPVIPSRKDVKLREFITLLMQHFKEEHQVSFYADALHITPQYLTLLVKRQTDKTVNAFIYELIYSEARNLLLATDLSIQEVAAKLNFADQASFSKFFKRHSGKAPQFFRELPRKNRDAGL